MTLEQLDYFIVIANSKTITQAAQKLNISQTGLSRAIHQLESEIGFSLFNRGRHGTTLTSKGRQFIGYAQRIISEYKTAQVAAKEIAGNNRKIVRIAVANTTSEIFSRFVNAQRNNSLTLQMKELPSDQIPPLIENGFYDAGLVALRKDKINSIENSFYVRKERWGKLKLYISKNNSLSTSKQLTKKNIQQLEYVLFEDKANDQSFNALENRIGPLNVIFHGGSNDMAAKVADKLGAALLARDFQMDNSDNSLFRNFSGFSLSRYINDEFCLCWLMRKDYKPSAAVRLLTGIMA